VAPTSKIALHGGGRGERCPVDDLTPGYAGKINVERHPGNDIGALHAISARQRGLCDRMEIYATYVGLRNGLDPFRLILLALGCYARALSIISSQICFDRRMSSTASRTAPWPGRAFVV